MSAIAPRRSSINEDLLRRRFSSSSEVAAYSNIRTSSLLGAVSESESLLLSAADEKNKAHIYGSVTEVVVAVQHAVLIASCCILLLITRNRCFEGGLYAVTYWQRQMVQLAAGQLLTILCSLRVPVSVVRDITLTFLHAGSLLHPVQASTLNT